MEDPKEKKQNNRRQDEKRNPDSKRNTSSKEKEWADKDGPMSDEKKLKPLKEMIRPKDDAKE